MTITNYDLARRYQEFKGEKNRFVDGLRAAYPDTNIMLNPKEFSQENPGNWFVMFAPSAWGSFQRGFGVHYTLRYYRERRTGVEYARLSVGVEKPLKNEYKDQFKKDVVTSVRSKKLHLPDCDLWPDAGIRTGAKLLETRVILDEHASRKLLARYHLLDHFNLLVAEILRRFNNEGKFGDGLIF